MAMEISDTLRRDIILWFASAAALLLLLYLHLLPAMIAGLLVYSLVNLLTPVLRTRLLWGEGPRFVAVSIIAAAVIALITLLAVSTSSMLRESNETLPALITRMAEIIEESRALMPDWMSDNMPADAEQLRIALVEWLRGNADIFQ